MKTDESAFAKGERVRLLKLSAEFLSDLPKEDVDELDSLIGREWTVEEWHHDIQQVEVIYWIYETAGATRSHSIWVPPDWIERKK